MMRTAVYHFAITAAETNSLTHSLIIIILNIYICITATVIPTEITSVFLLVHRNLCRIITQCAKEIETLQYYYYSETK